MPRNYTPKSPAAEIEGRRRSRFLRTLLENGGFVERAIRECHTSRRWLNEQLEDESFAELFQAIKDQNNEKIEEEIYRRAVVGHDRPKFNKGVPTGHFEREYSDNLLMFLAKANMPHKYRDLPQKGADLSDDELNARIKSLMDKRKAPAPDLEEGEPITESVM